MLHGPTPNHSFKRTCCVGRLSQTLGGLPYALGSTSERKRVLREPNLAEAAFPVGAILKPIAHRTLRPPLPNPTARSDGCFWGTLGKACRASVSPRGWLGLSVPLRWRPAHGSSYSNECNARACRARNHVRLEPVQGANPPMQARAPVVRKPVSQAQLRGSAMCTVGSSARQATQLVFLQPPNPSIEGTPSGLRPPSAPHVTR